MPAPHPPKLRPILVWVICCRHDFARGVSGRLPEAPTGTYIVFMADIASRSGADGVLGPGDLRALATARLTLAP